MKPGRGAAGLAIALVWPLGASGAEGPPRFGIVLGASVLSRDDRADRGRSSEIVSIGPSPLLGATFEIPTWNEASHVGFEVGYGPYHRDETTFCVTRDFPVIERVCSVENATAGVLHGGLQFTHAFGREKSLRPWLAAGTGLRLTWFEPEFGERSFFNSQTFHVAAGAVGRRVRLEARLAMVLHHPHPGPSGGPDDTRLDLQVRLTVFPFGPGRSTSPARP